jgi:hypothetical protein
LCFGITTTSGALVRLGLTAEPLVEGVLRRLDRAARCGQQVVHEHKLMTPPSRLRPRNAYSLPLPAYCQSTRLRPDPIIPPAHPAWHVPRPLAVLTHICAVD